MGYLARAGILAAVLLVVLFSFLPGASAIELELVGILADGLPNRVAISGDRAYVTTGQGVWTVDISDSLNPVRLDIHPVPSKCRDLALTDSLLYVAMPDSGLAILRIGTESLEDVAYLELPDGVLDVEVQDGYAYVMDSGSVLRVIDVSHPGSPAEVAQADLGGTLRGLQVVGDYVYTCSIRCPYDRYYARLRAIDISDPLAPAAVATGPEISGEYTRLYAKDGRAYLTVWPYIDSPNGPDPDASMFVFDVQNPYSMSIVGSLWLDGDGIYGLYVQNDIAYVGLYGSLAIYDMSDPGAMTRLGRVLDTGRVVDIAVSGKTVYHASDGIGLMAVDASDPASPEHLATVYPMANVNRVFADGGYAYFTGKGGLWIADISDPAAPELRGSTRLPGSGGDVFKSGDYAYVIGLLDPSGLRTVDVSDPYHPRVVGSADTPGEASRIFVQGDYAYVLDHGSGPDGLRVISIADPEHPELVGTTTVTSYNDPWDLYVVGDYAYVAENSYMDLGVVDVSEPTEPATIAELHTSGFFRAIHVQGDYAYQVNLKGSLNVIDISDPYEPGIVGWLGIDGRLQDIFVTGSIAYAADQEYGIRLIDVSDPSRPLLVGGYPTNKEPKNLFVSDGYLYMAAYGSGLWIFRAGYSISGYIRDSLGNGVSDVTVTLSSPDSQATFVTGITGYYEFGGLAAGSYTVRPERPEWSFTPAERSLFVLEEDLADQDFEGATPLLEVSGLIHEGGIPIEGVVVSVTGDLEAADTTGADGLYAFELNRAGHYQITPSKQYWLFSPESRLYSDLAEDQTGQDFTGERVLFSIGGQVVLEEGEALAGAVVHLYGWVGDTQASTYDTTGSDGSYAFSDVPKGSYSVSASKDGYGMSPSGGYLLGEIDRDHPDLRFTADWHGFRIAGQILDDRNYGVPGVVLRLTGDTTKVDTSRNAWDAGAIYEFSHLDPGRYRVTPSKPGWIFTPEFRLFADFDADIYDQDFTGTFLSGNARVRGNGSQNTWVDVSPPEQGTLRLRIYSAEGRLVWSASRAMAPGEACTFEWDHRTRHGERVASGVYALRIEGCGLSVSKKLSVVR